MLLKSLTIVVKETIQKYPNLRNEVLDIYELAKDEIEDGGSEEHECELALNDINELVQTQSA